jgi:tRNA1(Val) A37 N6-methylase TrmN6
VALFYFHLRTGDQLILDEEGQNLPDLFAARREAEKSARELLAEAIKGGKEKVADSFVIVDEQGQMDTFLIATVLPKSCKK